MFGVSNLIVECFAIYSLDNSLCEKKNGLEAQTIFFCEFCAG